MWDPEEDNARQPLMAESSSKALPNDPSWKGVKTEGRKPTDVLFAIVYVLMFVGMIIVSSVAFTRGDPSLLKQYPDIEDKAEHYFQDGVAVLKESRNILVGGLCVGLFLSILWVQLMKMFTKIFIYITLVGGVLAVLGLGGYLYSHGSKEDGLGKDGSSFFWASYVAFGAAGVLSLTIIFLRKKIALTSALITETCRGVQRNPSLFLVAALLAALFVGFVAYWVSTFVFLWSIPESTVKTDPNDPVKFETSVRNLMYYQVFGLFWTGALFSAIFQATVAGTISSWYFNRNGMNASTEGAFSALGRAVTYSFGSLAFGSLILAIVQFVTFLLEQSKRANKKNKIVVAIISCIQCVLGCLESLVKKFNKFAYVYVAMYGESFCTSAGNVFNLMERNFFNLVIVDLMSGFVMFVGKLLGVCLTAIIVLLIADATATPVAVLPIAIVVASAWFIFTISAHILGMGVDTVLVCYLEDLERNTDGSYHINPELHNMLQDRTQKLKEEQV